MFPLTWSCRSPPGIQIWACGEEQHLQQSSDPWKMGKSFAKVLSSGIPEQSWIGEGMTVLTSVQQPEGSMWDGQDPLCDGKFLMNS